MKIIEYPLFFCNMWMLSPLLLTWDYYRSFENAFHGIGRIFRSSKGSFRSILDASF